MTIDYRGLANADLNLLVALDALLREGNVTRAARHLGVGQSAMSGSLARLRRMLGDELLTRTADGMRLTPRAVSLVEPVRLALRQFQTIVSGDDAFDPATVERTFTVAMPGSMELMLGPKLLTRLSREAPGVRLRLTAYDYLSAADRLDADEIDLAIGVVPEGQAHHKARPIWRHGWLCLFNPGTVDVSVPISLDDFLRFPHVMTSLTGTSHGVVDAALAGIGRSRKLAATTPRFMTVPFLIRDAPVITTMVDELALRFAALLGLATSPVPVPLPDYTVSTIWHASYDRDPAHRWLRETVARLAGEAADDPAETRLKIAELEAAF